MTRGWISDYPSHLEFHRVHELAEYLLPNAV